MPVEKGQDWGRSGSLPPSAAVATSDQDAGRLVGEGAATIGIEAGDLARTLGIRSPYDRRSPKQLVDVDAVKIVLDDGTEYTAVAHVVLGHPVVHRESFAIMNAAFWSGRNIAPKAHPGDGRVDVVHLRLPAIDRVRAWNRMKTGSHVPHPMIKITRAKSGTVETGRRRPVWVDGRRVGQSVSVDYLVIPETVTVGVS